MAKKYPYRDVGSKFDVYFKQDMNANFDDIESDIKDNETRVNNILTGTEQPSEVVDARYDSVNDVTYTVLKDRLDNDATQLANIAQSTAYVESYKKIAPENDDTGRIQRAIDSGALNVVFADVTYTISSITIDNPVRLWGKSSNHHANVNVDTSIGVKLSDLPNTTVINHTSLTNPAFSLVASTKQSGIVIDGFLFYQEHTDYSNPTAYPYVISDELSTSYWSGVTIKNCMFINSYKGINLTKSERFDITDINGDFFNRGFNIGVIRDVSKLERIHIWNFARSTAADTFRQSASSDYAIYVNDVDELFASDIFIWDRHKGIYLEKVWGSFNRTTFDAVGKSFDIVDPKSIGLSIYDTKINCENDVSVVDGAISIKGSTVTDLSSVNIDGLVVWKGSKRSNAYNSAIFVDYSSVNLFLSNINVKYALTEGLKINKAKSVTVDGLLLSNYFPNQTANTLKTVGIRNEDETANVTIKNVTPLAVKFVFDGYIDKVSFDDKQSIIGLEPRLSSQSGTITASVTDGVKQAEYVGTDASSPYQGMRVLPTWNDKIISGKNYIMGLIYKNSTVLTTNLVDDTRFIQMPRTGTNEHFIPFDTKIHTGKRLTVIKITPSATGKPVVSNYARTFSGTTIIFGSFIVQSDKLAVSSFSGRNKIASAPTSSQEIWEAGDEIRYESPTAGGKVGVVCVTTGTPGTWKPYGTIDA